MTEFSDFENFGEHLPLNIEGAYQQFVDDSYYSLREDVPKPDTDQ